MKVGLIPLGRVGHQGKLRHAQNLSTNIFNACLPHLFWIIGVAKNPQRQASV